MKELLSTVLHSSLPTATMSSDWLIFMGYNNNCFFPLCGLLVADKMYRTCAASFKD